MKVYFMHFLELIPLRRELKTSLIVHSFLLLALLLWPVFRPLRPMRHEKYVSVNLRNLTSLPGPQAPTGAKPAPPRPPKEIPKSIPKPKTPPVVQKPAIKTPAPTKPPVPPPKPAAKPAVQTPSLSQRLQQRLEKVKTVAEKPRATQPPVKGRFVEPQEWSKLQRSSAGSQTQMSAAGLTAGAPGKVFPFSWYLDLVQSKITSNWKEPPRAFIDASRAWAVVSFAVERDGRISGIRMDARSNNPALDESVVEAVRVSDPLPPLPVDFPDRRLNVKIKFEVTE